MNEVQFIDSNKYSTTEWSGGKTSELFIHPETAVFKNGDFQLRVSIATVEVESSLFTSLPDVNRILMVLEGELKLEHEGHHTAELKPFDQDKFQGDWSTKSYGKVVDFNVMTKGGTSAQIQKIDLSPNEKLALTSAFDLQFVYVKSGVVKIDDLIIKSGNSFKINNSEYATLMNGSSIDKAEIILVSSDFN